MKKCKIQQVKWLPRDIKLGWKEDSPNGTLLCGWCNTTNTRQLWETISVGQNAEARFIGFICKSWNSKE